MAKNNRFGQAAILTDLDYAKIRRNLHSDHHKLLWDIARYTGERWGAICQLQVGDVYADPLLGIPRESITFRASTRKASPRGERSTREVPTHPSLQDILLRYNPAVKGSCWLFPGVLEGRPISFSTADKFLRAAIDRAGLSGKGISSHSTRRTFITRLAEKGIDIKTIQTITGHKDVRSMLNYVEANPERVRAAIATL
jgi:integrase/recombinase XerD